jgi:hypothetical protein
MQVLIMVVIDFLEDWLSLTLSHEIIFIFLRLYCKPNANESWMVMHSNQNPILNTIVHFHHTIYTKALSRV